MISNTARGDFNRLPLYRLEKAVYTLLWMKGGQGRQLLIETLHKMFPATVGVCSHTCKLMGYINPRGRVSEVPQPWPRYPITDMVNNPTPEPGAVNECPCFNFLDPEVGGPWRLRGVSRHHPFCQYQLGSAQRYQHFCQGVDYHYQVRAGHYHRGETRKLAPQRPDAWFRSLDAMGPSR